MGGGQLVRGLEPEVREKALYSGAFEGFEWRSGGPRSVPQKRRGLVTSQPYRPP